MFSGNGHQERIVTIGGTFDTLHIGHKEYIQLAFEYADRVLIYVSTDIYTIGKKSYGVKPYKIRIKPLQNYIKEIGCEGRYQIRCLDKIENLQNDLVREKIYMVIVSPEYYNFFLQINHAREKSGVQSFLILVKPRVNYHVGNQVKDISSSNMRYRQPNI